MGAIVDISEVLLQLGLSSSVSEEERAIAAVAITSAEGAVRRYLRYDPVSRQRTEYYPQQDFSQFGRSVVWEATDTQAVLRQLSEASTTELQVQHIPIRSTPAIDLRVDYDGRCGAKSGSFAASTQKTEGDDYWPNYDVQDSSGNRVCRDGIIRSNGTWPTQAGSVKITYTAGYTAAEMHGQDTAVDASLIADAVLNEVIRRMKKIYSGMKTDTGLLAGPVVSEKLGDYTRTVDSGAVARTAGSTIELLPDTKDKLEMFVNWGWSLGS